MKKLFKKFRKPGNLKNILLLSLLVVIFPGHLPVACAADSFFINTGAFLYPGTVTSDDIDATNFVNTGYFDILSGGTSLYETRDTLNYTNSGEMTCYSGFLMDDENPLNNSRSMSSSILNSGSIYCSSGFVSTNGGLFISSSTSFGIFFSGLYGYAALATNIINPGLVDVGQGASMDFIGNDVDLSGATLTFEGPTYNTSGVGIHGTNYWDPSYLTATSAGTGFFSTNAVYSNPGYIQYGFTLNPTVPFYSTNAVGTNSETIHSAFVQDFSGGNVSYAVYFNTGGKGLGPGNVTIQWSAPYTNLSTGVVLTNYLYLNNDFLAGSSTNLNFINGLPSNFQITQSFIPLLTNLTAATSNFYSGFVAGPLTNLSSLGIIYLSSGSASTNQIANGSPTNLPDQLVISASHSLNLTNAQISGPNYVSIQAPNQFAASSGASFAAPYLDLSLGSTNGSLVVSNLIAAQIPYWNGLIQAWSTRWLVGITGTNGSTTTGTNDFRVLVVSSFLSPTTLPQIMNMALNATNNLTFSDSLNILNSFSANSLSLTITTNDVSLGAASPEGGLNIENPLFNWPSAFPDLLNLTNFGSIYLANNGVFESSTNSTTVTPGTPQANATAVLSEVSGATNVAPLDTVTVGYTTYTYVKHLTNTIADQVSVASSLAGSISNLIQAINVSSGSGTLYSTNTTGNPLVTAGPFVTNGFTVTSILTGPSGNGLPVSVSSKSLVWSSGSSLSGGVNATPGTTNVASVPVWYDNFINQGSLIASSLDMFANNFVNGGFIFSDNIELQAQNAAFSGGSVSSIFGISLASQDLVVSNALLTASGSISLQVTNLLSDGVAAGPVPLPAPFVWNVGGTNSSGLNLLDLPASGGLLGTAIYATPPPNKVVYNTWAGADLGANPSGFNNNAAIGELNLAGGLGGVWYYFGTGSSNAIYIDSISLNGSSAATDSQGNPVALKSAPNFNIYYAQAYSNGVSVAKALDGKNNGHLHWVSSYVGHFSSAAYTYNGQTYYVNAGLLASSPSSVFVAGQVNLTPSLTNVAPNQIKLQWNTPPGANNIVQYTTNLVSGPWLTLPKISQYYYGSGVSVSNSSASGFISPQSASGPVTNVWIFDSLTNSSERYYRVEVLQ